MLAIGLAVFLFCCFYIVGLPLVTLLATRRPIPNALLAPAVGLAAMELLLFALNRGGLPISVVAWPLLFALLLASLVILLRKRPQVFTRQMAPYAAILMGAILLTGWPMLFLGFDWLAFANDDMANYCLGANRLLNHGFYDLPDVDELLSGKDHSQWLWCMYVGGGVRCGGELINAWTCALTGLTPSQTFMPVLIALNLCLITALGSLVHRGHQARTVSLLTCALGAISAQNTLGVVYQLSAQVGGIAFLSAILTAVSRVKDRFPLAGKIRVASLVGILGAALLIHYPETVPFAALAVLLHSVIMIARRKCRVSTVLVTASVALVLACLLIQDYFLSATRFLLAQAGHSGQNVTTDELLAVFPYYLVPRGLATFWGFFPFSSMGSSYLVDVAIVLGAALLVLAVIVCIRRALQGEYCAVIGVIMLALSVVLFKNRSGFGLFKLAMFAQPYICAIFILCAVRSKTRRPFWVTVCVGLGLINVLTQFRYANLSYARDSIVVEIGNGSRDRLLAQLRTVLRNSPTHTLLFDFDNNVLAKLACCETIGRETEFACALFAENLRGFAGEGDAVLPKLRKQVTDLDLARAIRQPRVTFSLHDANEGTNSFQVSFAAGKSRATQEVTLVGCRGPLARTNRFRYGVPETTELFGQDLRKVSNHAIFVSSGLGGHHYLCLADKSIGLYREEPDWFYPRRTMWACGRYQLYEIVNPTDTVRVGLELTSTLLGDGRNELPEAWVIGDRRVKLPLCGRGAARVWSEALKPQWIEGRAYVMVDMGKVGKRFPVRVERLERLWGNDIIRDKRYLVCHERDMSVVSESEYASMHPPCKIESFPRDLADQNIQYSGLYEDGWGAEHSFVVLAHPGGMATLRLKGTLDSQITDRVNTLTVLVDDVEVGTHQVGTGDFVIEHLVPGPSGNRKIELRWNHVVSLPGADRRPAAMLWRQIGFFSGTTSVADQGGARHTR